MVHKGMLDSEEHTSNSKYNIYALWPVITHKSRAFLLIVFVIRNASDLQLVLPLLYVGFCRLTPGFVIRPFINM